MLPRTEAESTAFREALVEQYGGDPLLFLEGAHFDQAVVGITSEGIVAYSALSIVEGLMVTNEWDRETAHEYADFNIFGAFMGEQTPIYIWMQADEQD